MKWKTIKKKEAFLRKRGWRGKDKDAGWDSPYTGITYSFELALRIEDSWDGQPEVLKGRQK